MYNYHPKHKKKENSKNFVIFYGKLRPKGEKMPEKMGDLFISKPNTSRFGH